MSFFETLRVPAQRDQLARIRGFIEQRAGQTPASVREVWDLVQAVDEAATNIILHGYRDGEGEIEVEAWCQPGRITVILRDQAPPFNPTQVPEPDLTLPLHLRPPGGLGIHLIRKCVDEFRYSVRPRGGNELTLVKDLKEMGGSK